MKEITDTVQKLISNSYSAVTTITPYLLSFVSSFFIRGHELGGGHYHFSLSALFKRNPVCQLSKTVNAVLKPEKAKSVIEFTRYVDNTFRQVYYR